MKTPREKAWEATRIAYTRRLTGSFGDGLVAPETDFDAKGLASIAPLPADPGPKPEGFVRAVEVGADGQWHAYGYSDAQIQGLRFDEIIDDSFEGLQAARRVWIEAEVPLPTEAIVIAGEVTEA